MKKSINKLTNIPSAIFLITQNLLRIQGNNKIIVRNSISIYAKNQDSALLVIVVDNTKMVSKFGSHTRMKKFFFIEVQLI